MTTTTTDTRGAVATPSLSTPALDVGLLVLRLVPAIGLGWHGIQKLQDPEGASGLFEMLGFPSPQGTAVFQGLLEVALAVLFLAGALTALAGAGLVGTMLVAISLAHWDAGFPFDAGAMPDAATPMPGYEYPLALLLVGLALAATGPGRFAVDSTVLSRIPAIVRGGTVGAFGLAAVLGLASGAIVAVAV